MGGKNPAIVTKHADLDVATRMAAVLRSAPDVVGGGAFAWTWAGVAISAAAVAAGLALTRPSETARRACVVLVAASAAHSVIASPMREQKPYAPSGS